MEIKIDLSHEAIERITGARLRGLEVENNFYDRDFLEELEDNDEISISESGFMWGYLEA